MSGLFSEETGKSIEKIVSQCPVKHCYWCERAHGNGKCVAVRDGSCRFGDYEDFLWYFPSWLERDIKDFDVAGIVELVNGINIAASSPDFQASNSDVLRMVAAIWVLTTIIGWQKGQMVLTEASRDIAHSLVLDMQREAIASLKLARKLAEENDALRKSTI